MRKKVSRGLCRICRRERMLDASFECSRCRCRPKVISRPRPTKVARVIWPPEAKTRGICGKCAAAVPLLDDGRTSYHKRGTAEKIRRAQACAGSAKTPTALAKPALRRVPRRPGLVDERVHHGGGRGIVPAGFHM